MAVSAPVRAYYTQRIFNESGRDRAPRNFRPLEVAPTGRSSVEGCAGGGKNVLELSLLAPAGVVEDLRASCGLCNPAMYAAVDIVIEWARGQALDDLLRVDPLDVASLAPLFARLGGPGRPDDAREKFQYALLALQHAIRAQRGLPLPPLPQVPPPTERDLDEPE